MACGLIKSGFIKEGYLLLLSTWNFAYFRYVVNSFDMDEFGRCISKTMEMNKKIEGQKLEGCDLDANEGLIMDMYETMSASRLIKYTGATKLLSLMNPHIFVMWDSFIRKECHVGQKPQDYVRFLRIMKTACEGLAWDSDKPLAKAIDEYNYMTISLSKVRKKGGDLKDD
ncbi:MAG: hypothetical protein LLG37_01640 [Spirochaetia bacterium]|nr:hypothetical protein [Spirochaetia bacterium]